MNGTRTIYGERRTWALYRDLGPMGPGPWYCASEFLPIASEQREVVTVVERAGGDEAARAEVAILRNLEVAAREVDAFFGGGPEGGWKFDNKTVRSGEAVDGLLSMHDWLNHLGAIRSGVRGSVESALEGSGGDEADSGLDAEHRAIYFPDVIERWECPKHGQSTAVLCDGCHLCHPSRPLKPVLRRYVLVALDKEAADG